ncbi:hypothetical protein C0J52_14897 [Blattella germanica]|nr:hypothetical protein C0J52_14897 [Blattella germanica]
MEEEPASLQSQCLKCFNTFMSQICVKCLMIHPQQWNFDWLQNMIYRMPPILANELTTTLLKSIDTLPFDSYYYNEHVECFDFIYKLIDAIVHPEVTELILSRDELQTFPHVLTWNFVIPFLCKSMFSFQKLRIIRFPKCRVHVEIDFPEQNGTLENLIEFTYANHCTNELLKNVVESNIHLKRLDLMCSKNITDESIDGILKLHYLEYLHLRETSISSHGLMRLMTSALGKQLKYVGFSSRTCGDFACVVSELQCITTLNISCNEFNVDAIFGPKPLNNLLHLKALTVHSEERGLEMGLETLINILGTQLVYLNLSSASPNIVNIIMRHCVRLECLIINSFFSSIEQIYLDTQPGFKSITSIYLRTSTAEDTVKYILSCCINVKKISIQTCFSNDCMLMDEVLKKNPLVCLEELTWWPTGTLATTKVIHKVINCCPTLEVFRGSYVWCRKGDVQKLLEEVQEFYPEARILKNMENEN